MCAILKGPLDFEIAILFCISNALHHLPTWNKQMIVSCHSPFRVFLEEKEDREIRKSKEAYKLKHFILHPDSEFRTITFYIFHLKKITYYVSLIVVYCLVSAGKLLYQLLLSSKNNITLHCFSCHSSFR